MTVQKEKWFSLNVHMRPGCFIANRRERMCLAEFLVIHIYFILIQSPLGMLFLRRELFLYQNGCKFVLRWQIHSELGFFFHKLAASISGYIRLQIWLHLENKLIVLFACPITVFGTCLSFYGCVYFQINTTFQYPLNLCNR